MNAFKERSICNSNGIRIYPVRVGRDYYLEIEFNKTAEFDSKYIKKLKRGEMKFDPNKKEWSQKIMELYRDLYEMKFKKAPRPKKQVTN